MKVRDFYHDKVLFITGCTGFLGNLSLYDYFTLGKVVLEKIFRTCPSVRRIYLLIRPKVQTTD